ncbi:hypothetical protein [uncultured Pedobacter sp.]|uniref:hypothetical protein n=1 Tax=uncultured Pedobacter sp. TaxID=246139 RepID=UPI0025F7E00E|nr:hypothetical protein [uncultured Pedobacter sp.]
MDAKDNYSEQQNLTVRFEEMAAKVLEKSGFSIEFQKFGSFDFLAVLENSFANVEVKFYRSKSPKLDLLQAAVQNLRATKDNPNSRLLLIISSVISPSLKREIFDDSGVVVWDAAVLLSLAYEHSTIYYELENLLSRAYGSIFTSFTKLDIINKVFILSEFHNAASPKTKVPIKAKGAELCEQLKKIIIGRPGAAAFERKCVEILKYLFDNDRDLTLWETQPTTEDGLHRFDLLTRIIAHQQTFFTEIGDDFHSRYVLFEFKNYKERITQAEIYTTEKYLFLTALRSISVIIARNGFDLNSYKAAKGALKEHGKLILIISGADLCEMLNDKDLGNEPSALLRRKVDELLSKLTR